MEQDLVSLLNNSFGHGSSVPGPSRLTNRAPSYDSLFSETSEPTEPSTPAIEPKKSLKRKRLSHIEVPSLRKPYGQTRQFSKYDPKTEQTMLSLGFAPWAVDDAKSDDEYAEYCEDATWLNLQLRGIPYERHRKTQPEPLQKDDFLKWRSDTRGWDLPAMEYPVEDKSTTASAYCGWDGLVVIPKEAKTRRKLVPTVLVDKPKAKQKLKPKPKTQTNPVMPQPLYLNGKRLSKPSYSGTPIVIDTSDDSDYGSPRKRKRKNKKSTPKYRRPVTPLSDDDDYSPPSPPKRSLSKSRPKPRPSSVVPETSPDTSPEPPEFEEVFETQLGLTMNLANMANFRVPASTLHTTPKSVSPQKTLGEPVSDKPSSSTTHNAPPQLPIHTMVPPTSSYHSAFQGQERHHPVRIGSSSVPSVYSKAVLNSSFYQSFQPPSSPFGSPRSSPQRAQSQPSPFHSPMPNTVPRSPSLPVPVNLAPGSDNVGSVEIPPWADLAPVFAKRLFPSLNLPSHPPRQADQPLNLSQFVHLSPQDDEAQVDHFPPTDNSWSLEDAEEAGAGNGTINPVLLQPTPRAPTLSPQAPFNLDLDDTNPSGPRHFNELFGDEEFGEGLLDPDHEPGFSSRSGHVSLYNLDHDYETFSEPLLPMKFGRPKSKPNEPFQEEQLLSMKFGRPKSKPKPNGHAIVREDEITPDVKVKYSALRQTVDGKEQSSTDGKGKAKAKGRDKNSLRSPAFIRIQSYPGLVDDDDKDEDYYEGPLPKTKGNGKAKGKGKAKPRALRQSDDEYQDEPLPRARPKDEDEDDPFLLPNINGRSKANGKGKGRAKDYHDDEDQETEGLPAKRASKPSARLLESQQDGVEETTSPRRNGKTGLKIKIRMTKENEEKPGHIAVPVDGAEIITQPLDGPSTSTNLQENQAPPRPADLKIGFPTHRREWPRGEEALFCHPCRTRSYKLHMVCSMEHCTKMFCQRCITIRFPLYEFDHTQTDWMCFCCADECTCDVCTRRRGEIYVSLRPGEASSSSQPLKKTRVTRHGNNQDVAAPAVRRRASKPIPVDEAPPLVFRDVLEPMRPWAVVYGVDNARLIGEAFTDGTEDIVVFKGDLTKLVRAAPPSPELPPHRPRSTRLKRKRSTLSDGDDTDEEPDEEESEKRRKVRVYVGHLIPSSKWQVVEGKDIEDIDDPRRDPDHIVDDEEEQGPFVKTAYGMRQPGVISYTGKIIRWFVGNRKTLDWKCSLKREDELSDEDAEGETEDGDVAMLDPLAEVQYSEPLPLISPMDEFDGPLSPLTVSGGEYCGRSMVDGKPDVSPKMNQGTTSPTLTTMTDLAKAPGLDVDQVTLVNVISLSLISVGTTPLLVGLTL